MSSDYTSRSSFRYRKSGFAQLLPEPMLGSHVGRELCRIAVYDNTLLEAGLSAHRLSKQLHALPFNIEIFCIDAGNPTYICCPWQQFDLVCAALQSLRPNLTEDKAEASEHVLRKKIDDNTLASLVGLGAGVWRNLVPIGVRKWRFSDFSIDESFSFGSTTWKAIDLAFVAEVPHAGSPAEILIRGGFNTINERSRMARRLIAACDMRGRHLFGA